MKVGLPRALLYHRYGRFWEEYLTALGAEVVVSRRTDKALLETGLGLVPSEVCLPIKIIAGHLKDLEGRVDTIFLPRMMWLEDTLYACPKMIGIVDLARMMLRPEMRLIAPAIRGDFMFRHFLAGLALNPNPVRVAQALSRAQKHIPVHTDVPDFPAGEKRIGLISHFYNLEDDFISGAIVDTFKQHGYRICTKDELPQHVLIDRAGMAGNIRWVYERELYNAFRFLLGRVDGMCLIVSMGCGPDSLVAEFMREEAREQDVPFLELVIDEHTGTAGVTTRIEAFAELAERRTRRTGVRS
jgi:predicted nucleotide-binding protein (sugar kinase/HSP70/actin superfamily)